MNGDIKVKRAWHVLSNRWNSAITEYALSAARALRAQGWQTLFSPLAGTPAESRAQKYGIDTFSFPSFNLGQWSTFRRTAQDFHPDLICVYGGPETFLLHTISRRSVNLRLRARADELDKKFGALRGVLAHPRIDGIIVPSLRYKKYFNKISSLPVEWVRLGVSAKDFFFDENLYQPRHDRVTLTVLGRFDPVKGHKRVFALFRRLKESWPSEGGKLFLQIIGQPANLSVDDLVYMAHQEYLELDVDYGVVSHRLSIEDLRYLLINSSLGIISSLASEVICRVGEEFLVAGAPIMVSGIGSLEELLFSHAGQSYKGLSDNEIVSLWKYTVLASSRETGRERIARAELAREIFSLETMGQTLESFFQCVKEKKGHL